MRAFSTSSTASIRFSLRILFSLLFRDDLHVSLFQVLSHVECNYAVAHAMHLKVDAYDKATHDWIWICDSGITTAPWVLRYAPESGSCCRLYCAPFDLRTYCTLNAAATFKVLYQYYPTSDTIGTSVHMMSLFRCRLCLDLGKWSRLQIKPEIL